MSNEYTRNQGVSKKITGKTAAITYIKVLFFFFFALLKSTRAYFIGIC